MTHGTCKTKYRAKDGEGQWRRITITSYRQPILPATEQQASPSLTARAERQLYVASVLGSGAVGDGGPHDHSDRLPHAQQRTRSARQFLGQELEGNRSIDKDIAAEANARKEIDAADHTVVVYARVLAVRLVAGCFISDKMKTWQHTRSMHRRRW